MIQFDNDTYITLHKMYKVIIETTQKPNPSIFIKSPILQIVDLTSHQNPSSNFPQLQPQSQQSSSSSIPPSITQIHANLHLLRNLSLPHPSPTSPTSTTSLPSLPIKSPTLLILNLANHSPIETLLSEQLTQIQYFWKIVQKVTNPEHAVIGSNCHAIVVFKSIVIAEEFWEFLGRKVGVGVGFYLDGVRVAVGGDGEGKGMEEGKGKEEGKGNEEEDCWVELPHCQKCLEALESDVTGISSKYPNTHKQQMMPSNPTCRVCQIRSKKQSRCSGCSQMQDNWVCMVCGTIGCGRYKNADAFKHYSTSKHILSLDLQTNRIWNYKLDCFSHRIFGKQDYIIQQHCPKFPKQDQNFEDDRVQQQFWKYCNVVSEQLDRQRNFYNCIKEEEIERYASQEKGLEEKLGLVNKMREEKKENLKKKLKKNKKLAKRYTELQEECKQERELSKILEESVKNRDKYEKKESEVVMRKREELRRLEEEIGKILVSLQID